MLRAGAIDFEGVYHKARDCELRPRGPTVGGPPILIGCLGPKMLRLTARYADLWNVYWFDTDNSANAIPDLRRLVDEACLEVGRNPHTLERTATVLVGSRDSASGSGDDEPDPLTGTPEEIATELKSYHAEGISHIQITLESAGMNAIEEFGRVLELLR